MKRILIIISLYLLVYSSIFGGEEMKIHECSGAGRWFEASEKLLAKEVDGFFGQVENKYKDKKITAIISPHAGFTYSGKAAAAGFISVKDKSYKRVILLGVNHMVYLRKAALLDVDAFETPLGNVELDQPVVEELLKNEKYFISDPKAHVSEHSIENQLPFLQRGLKPGFKIVPILICDMSDDSFKAVAKILKQYVDDQTLIVVSSDFTHYGQYFQYVPFKTDIRENLKKLDMGAVDLIIKKDFDGFSKYIDRTGATICGRNGISVLLNLLPEDAVGDLAMYYTSSEMTGDFSSSVSYASIVFYKK